ncbi:hypothetical protein NM688_g4743 [Phlebia brevispora]|uniref:Uncharacterized protein n=1 Tax=Phlebia brevispora TaxID=194682 RepID=A0ACC1T227_9APHY|nr:hypothetical protein NM688_g4743 [Phlebia brevispora]
MQNHTKRRPRIIDDLVPIILESNDHWWPRDFQRLALVSPAWVGPVRQSLYAYPHLRTFHACNLFARTMMENPYILSLVKGIDLRPAIPMGCTYSLSEQDMTSLRFILNLKGLRTVTLGGELAVQAGRFLQMMSHTRTICSLHIDGSDLEDSDSFCWRQSPSLEWNEAIAFRFVGLRELKLTHLQLSISDPPLPYALPIMNLILDNVSLAHGSIQHLCHESWDAVRSLSVSLKIEEHPDVIVRELLECCTNLECLRYESCDGGAHGDIFADDAPLTSLRTLVLADIDINPQVLLMLNQACQSMEQLSVLGRAVRLKQQEWANILHSGAFPSLRRLCIPCGSNEPPFGFSTWSEDAKKLVSDSCNFRGVMLFFN